jgi:hypothetical protein
VNGDEPIVSRAQNVGLREPGAIARGRRATESKKRSKGFNREMCHRLQHRDLDEITLTGPSALNECTQHAVSRIDARNRIGECRT